MPHLPITIGKDDVNHYHVSTILIGNGYAFDYETMVFSAGEDVVYEARYATEWEAKIGHLHAIYLARNDKFLPRESAPPTAQQL